MFAVVQKVKAGFDDEIVRCIIGVFDDIESANETVIQMNAAMCEAFSDNKRWILNHYVMEINKNIVIKDLASPWNIWDHFYREDITDPFEAFNRINSE
jgi:hypothetical protein